MNILDGSIKIQIQLLHNLFPNRARGVSYSDLLLGAVSAEGSEMEVQYKTS